MIGRILVANRGEIALRVVRACREMGIESVAVYSDPDLTSPHVAAATRAVRLGPAPATDSYLSIPRLIDAARSAAADAVHPGYGFLAENPEFAAACEEAGLIFIGPSADVIEQMGSKIGARATMAAAGVPVVPGATPEEQSTTGIEAAALAIGLPVLIKASAGGGGKGMRVVREADDLAEAIEAARREAASAFGDGTLYVERLVEHPRHVEIQVLGDGHGNAIHLFERDCSVQRRHQKVVEESPSPTLTPSVRDRMGEAAVRAARAVGYRNAGTVEFLLAGEGDEARFYFLEMNTRLQVEHPVTEAVTGVDLVRAQIDIAAAGVLPFRQEDLSQRGHAIECRVYAEDPAHGFLPQAGRLLLYREPQGPGIRIDSGVVEGREVTVHYDPLIAKLIASASTRRQAIARAHAALRRYPVLGLHTNIPFLIALVDHPRFVGGQIDTMFLDSEGEAIARADASDPPFAAIAAAAMHQEARAGLAPRGGRTRAAAPDPWGHLVDWRI